MENPIKPNKLSTHSVDLKFLIETMVSALVDDNDSVGINIIPGEQTTVYELYVGKADRGKVIGKQGRNALAMRTILNAAATKMQKRVVLEIMEK